MPELELTPKLKRKYLHPIETSHVVGYVAKVSEKDIDSTVALILLPFMPIQLSSDL